MEYPLGKEGLHGGKPGGEFPLCYSTEPKKLPAPSTATYMRQAAERLGLRMVVKECMER